MNQMRFRGWILAALVLCASVPAAVAQFSLVASPDVSYVPQLGEIMTTVQLQHLKLYFAGKEGNWNLASYELRQLRAGLVEAALLYGGIPVSNVTTMAEPLQQVGSAIEKKDGRRFANAVARLTDGCNACHQSMNRGFIVMRLPTEQPFSNQVFSPRNSRKATSGGR